MVASNSALLVLRTGKLRPRIIRAVEVAPATFVFPLQWLVLGRFHDAELLDSSLRLSHVDGVTMAGIPGPRALGAPTFAYVLLLALGWLTLSIPLLVRFSLSGAKVLALDEAKDYVNKVVRESAIASSQMARIAKKIQSAESVADIAQAIAQTRE